jgi:hypothetical protein
MRERESEHGGIKIIYSRPLDILMGRRGEGRPPTPSPILYPKGGEINEGKNAT